MPGFRSTDGHQGRLRFYERLGFTIVPLGDKLAHVRLGDFDFLLQEFYMKDFWNPT